VHLVFCSRISLLKLLCFHLGINLSLKLNRVLLLQKKVVRLLSNAFYDAHYTSSLFKSKMMLKFKDIYLLNLGKFMFSYQSNLLPPSFSNFFSTTDQIHSHNLLTAGQFYVPFCRTKAKQFTVKYKGPKFFNSLNSEIRDSPSISTFQLKLINIFCLFIVNQLSCLLYCCIVLFSCLSSLFANIVILINVLYKIVNYSL
jgi:hypothetical protein